MKNITSCPYGHTCEDIYVSNGVKYHDRCVKYIEVATKNEKDEIVNTSKCSEVWGIEIAIMNNKLAGNIVNAVDEVRVQSSKRQDIALQIAAGQFLQKNILESLPHEENT